jgi:hypothetical protein
MFAVLLVPVYISDVHDVHEFIDKSSAEPGWGYCMSVVSHSGGAD